MHGAVARLAERAYERLDPEQQDVARRILLRLAGEGEGDAVVRRRVPLAELERRRRRRRARPCSPTSAWSRSARARSRSPTRRCCASGRACAAGSRRTPQGRHLHHQLRAAAREWDAGGRDPGELYRGARLAAALDWSAAHERRAQRRPSARSSTTSRAASERSQRRLRAMLAGVAALLVLAVIAGRRRARAARHGARAGDRGRRPAARRARPRRDRASTARCCSPARASRSTTRVQTRGNLLAALLKSPAAIGVLRGDGERMLGVALSPDERTLAAGDAAGNVFLFDTETRRRVATHQAGERRLVDRRSSPTARTAAGSRSRTTPREATW